MMSITKASSNYKMSFTPFLCVNSFPEMAGSSSRRPDYNASILEKQTLVSHIQRLILPFRTTEMSESIIIVLVFYSIKTEGMKPLPHIINQVVTE